MKTTKAQGDGLSHSGSTAAEIQTQAILTLYPTEMFIFYVLPLKSKLREVK